MDFYNNLLGLFYKLLGLPEVASAHGHKVDNFIVYVHWLMIALFGGWFIYFVITLWRFNAKRSAKANYFGVRSHTTTYLEVGVVVAESFLLLFLAIPLWGKVMGDFPKESESTVIQVVAQQFGWNARYGGPDGEFGKQDMKLVSNDNLFGVDPADPKGKDDVQVYNEFHVPVNKPVIAYISSKDVIHSFRVMTMRATQDAIPGMRVPLYFTPTKTGTNQILCAQLCGNGHAAMAGGRLIVDSPEDYAKWLKSKVGAATSFE
jgi:cytochrome c oxidase subunit 2